jgi:hypothetical protein
MTVDRTNFGTARDRHLMGSEAVTRRSKPDQPSRGDDRAQPYRSAWTVGIPVYARRGRK